MTRTGDAITVTMSRATPGARGRILALAAPGRIAFYDWEADAVLPSGKTVASRLDAQDPAAVTISQGTGGSSPGGIGAGCMAVQQTVALTGRLERGRPRRTEHVGGLTISVPSGFVVLQATDAASPVSGAYVLRADAALSGSDVIDPHETTLPGGNAGVSFKFTAAGRRQFQALTAAIARRGSLVSGLGATLNQHFAIAVDNRLISVPSIDYKVYPDGVNANDGADISGELTTQSAKDLAILLRYGPLPVSLTATG